MLLLCFCFFFPQMLCHLIELKCSESTLKIILSPFSFQFKNNVLSNHHYIVNIKNMTLRALILINLNDFLAIGVSLLHDLGESLLIAALPAHETQKQHNHSAIYPTPLQYWNYSNPKHIGRVDSPHSVLYHKWPKATLHPAI